MNILKQIQNIRDIEGNPKKALDLLNSSNLSSIESLNLKATLLRDLGNHKESLKVYEQALKLSKETNNLIQEVDILRSLSFWSLIFNRESNDCITYGELALKKSKELDINNNEHLRVLANTYAALGNVEFEKTKVNDKALEYYNIALTYSKQSNFIERILTVLGDMANVYLRTKKLKEAERLLKEILPEAKEKYRKVVPQILLRFAIVYKKLGDTKQAKRYAKEALEIAKKEGWDNDIKESMEFINNK